MEDIHRLTQDGPSHQPGSNSTKQYFYSKLYPQFLCKQSKLEVIMDFYEHPLKYIIFAFVLYSISTEQ